MGLATSRLMSFVFASRPSEKVDLPAFSAYGLKPALPSAGWPTLLRPPFVQTMSRWFRNINLISITYAFRPRLRDRLTLGRLTLPRKPWVYGERVFHPFFRYSCQHGLFCTNQMSLRSPLTVQNAPLPIHSKVNPAASVACLSPDTFSAQTHLTSELLRFL